MCITCILVLGVSLTSCTQSPEAERIPLVGYIVGYPPFLPVKDAFVGEMERLGYVDGETIQYDIDTSFIDSEKGAALLQEYLSREYDLLMVMGTEMALLAKEMTKESQSPLVFGYVMLEGHSLVNTISRPGGNMTGVRFPGPDLAVRRVELLLAAKPETKTILIPYLAGYPNILPQLSAIHQSDFGKEITYLEVPSSRPQELQDYLNRYQKSGKPPIDGIVLLAEPLSVDERFANIFVPFSKEKAIPIVGLDTPAHRGELLFSIFTDNDLAGTQMAFLADKVLKGENPGDIPILSPDYKLSINAENAEELGVTIPDAVINQASQINR